MQHRRRFKQSTSLKERLASFANEVREKALQFRPGPEQDALLKKARQADTAAHLEEWVNSPDCSHRNEKAASVGGLFRFVDAGPKPRPIASRCSSGAA